MKTISNITKKKKLNKNNFLIFVQRKNFKHEYQLRIDNIEKSLFIKCFPQWIYTYINKKIDRIYMRIRNRNNPTFELLFSGFNFKFSIDFSEERSVDFSTEVVISRDNFSFFISFSFLFANLYRSGVK